MSRFGCRLLGAALLCAAAFSAALRYRRELCARARALEEAAALLARTRAEIEWRLVPLPELLAAETASAEGAVRRFLEAVRAHYLRSLDMEAAFLAALELLPQGPVREALAPLGATLGRYDAGVQAQALRRAEEALRAAAAEARDTARTRSRLALRLLPGLALAAALTLW